MMASPRRRIFRSSSESSLVPSIDTSPQLAPTQSLLDVYKNHTASWAEYEDGFMALMAQRQIESLLTPTDFETRTALLCREATAEHCHRRLVCEYLADHWRDVRAFHL
jgi:uncharacterized protein YeaO (DUF488 family)